MSREELKKAKDSKKDEFYTQLDDIELEMKYYRKYFENKTILCNCDDPYESNFFKYFAMNFNYLGLKKLAATCYESSPIMYTQLDIFGNEIPYGIKDRGKNPYKIEITEVKDENGDGAVGLADVEILLKNRAMYGKPHIALAKRFRFFVYIYTTLLGIKKSITFSIKSNDVSIILLFLYIPLSSI